MDIGSLLHTFWTCPKLKNYWTAIFKTLSEVYKVKLAPCAFTALFGVIPSDPPMSKSYSNGFAFASLLAQRLVLLKWKQESPPLHD